MIPPLTSWKFVASEKSSPNLEKLEIMVEM